MKHSKAVGWHYLPGCVLSEHLVFIILFDPHNSDFTNKKTRSDVTKTLAKVPQPHKWQIQDSSSVLEHQNLDRATNLRDSVTSPHS